jgi:hypothetical protein
MLRRRIHHDRLPLFFYGIDKLAGHEIVNPSLTGAIRNLTLLFPQRVVVLILPGLNSPTHALSMPSI